VTLAEVDAIAATAGPGLIGGVMVGLVTGKALALAAGKPLIAVNHLEGHALSPRLSRSRPRNSLSAAARLGRALPVAAGRGRRRYRRLATTIDDAAGEAFDKTAKLLGLGFPGGPAVERGGAGAIPDAVPLPRPLLGSAEPHFSFAGLKSAVSRARPGNISAEDIAASFQQAWSIAWSIAPAARSAHDATALVVAGGVAANERRARR
jgi:N6-L-threonylcarbamoyladenine synthase